MDNLIARPRSASLNGAALLVPNLERVQGSAAQMPLAVLHAVIRQIALSQTHRSKHVNKTTSSEG